MPKLSVQRYSNWVRLLPILFFFVYLNATVLLLAFGPWDYSIEHPERLYLFLIIAHCSLLIGYLSVAFRDGRPYNSGWPVRKLLILSALVNLILLFPTSRYRTGSWIPNVAFGIENPGDAYAMFYLKEGKATPLIEYVRVLFGPLLFMARPLTIFYWQKLSKGVRLLGVMAILSLVAQYLSMGVNKEIAGTIAMVPCLLVAARFAGTLKLSVRKIIVGIAAISVIASLFLLFFSNTMMGRGGNTAVAGVLPNADAAADFDNVMVRDLSPEGQIGVVGLSMYLTIGYKALDLSLQEPWVPTFGVGNSLFLSRQAARVTGNDWWASAAYPFRIEKYGWDALEFWSSIYPWLASDFSFPGTILVVFFIGRLFALSWLDTLTGLNPFAVIVFAMFLIVLFYFPANNQMLQSGEDVSAFIVTLFLWNRTRRATKEKTIAVAA